MKQDRIEIIAPNDVALVRMAAGAVFSATTLPSGYIVPRAPKGKGYYPDCSEGKVELVLTDLHPQHRRVNN